MGCLRIGEAYDLEQLFGRRARDPACGPCWITVVLTPRRYRARTPGSRPLG